MSSIITEINDLGSSLDDLRLELKRHEGQLEFLRAVDRIQAQRLDNLEHACGHILLRELQEREARERERFAKQVKMALKKIEWTPVGEVKKTWLKLKSKLGGKPRRSY